MDALAQPNYHRDMYKVIAKSLYPLFVEHSDMWRLLPYLKKRPQEEYVDFGHWMSDVLADSVPDELQDCFTLLRNQCLGGVKLISNYGFFIVKD